MKETFKIRLVLPGTNIEGCLLNEYLYSGFESNELLGKACEKCGTSQIRISAYTECEHQRKLRARLWKEKFPTDEDFRGFIKDKNIELV